MVVNNNIITLGIVDPVMIEIIRGGVAFTSKVHK